MALNDALRQLHTVDQQLRGLESRLEGARRHVRAQQTKLDQLKQQEAELQDQLRHAQTSVASMENEIASADEKIERLREQMNSVKTNKEYSAMLVEVNTLKADRSKLEEKALEEMSRVDALKSELEQVQSKIADQQRIKDHADKELADREAEVGDRLAELKTEREQAASHVPAEALQVFDRLAETYEGEAMAPVIEEDRRRMEYTCGGCYMQIPVEKVNLLVSSDDLVRCSSCARILYFESELKETMSPR